MVPVILVQKVHSISSLIHLMQDYGGRGRGSLALQLVDNRWPTETNCAECECVNLVIHYKYNLMINAFLWRWGG